MDRLEELVKVDTENVSVDTLIETQAELEGIIFAKLNSMVIAGINKIVEIERQLVIEELTPRNEPIVDKEENNENESDLD